MNPTSHTPQACPTALALFHASASPGLPSVLPIRPTGSCLPLTSSARSLGAASLSPLFLSS